MDRKTSKGKSGLKAETFDVFVSYCRADKYLVEPVVQLVAIGRKRVFWDAAGLQPGDRWKPNLLTALHNSKMLVLLWCCHSARSQWVERETALAHESGKPIIPVLLCSFPTIRPVSEYQWIDGRPMVRHPCECCLREGHPPQPVGDPPIVVAAKEEFGMASVAPEEVARTCRRIFPTSPRIPEEPLLALGLEVVLRLAERNELHRILQQSESPLSLGCCGFKSSVSGSAGTDEAEAVASDC